MSEDQKLPTKAEVLKNLNSQLAKMYQTITELELYIKWVNNIKE